jgi:hypothetical protein
MFKDVADYALYDDSMRYAKGNLFQQPGPSYSMCDSFDQLPVVGLAPVPGLLAQRVIDS